ncbi:hypothetical protein KR093_001763 [Drosophila rubida]|uniref:Caspase Dronc n=1 Tax=Drosophila rubida TaxID=30044 RepID=A0AAD4JXZ7_9MUSC|nr:hypothetical protein KR093_001763 [Drosophila rubida]
MEVEHGGERELGMQQKHRKHIEANIANLRKCTNYKAIMHESVVCGLLSETMRHNIEELNGEAYSMPKEDQELEKHRRYFLKITKRGPLAYEDLKKVLRRLGYVDALRILDSVDNQNNEFISINQRPSGSSNNNVVNSNSNVHSNNNNNGNNNSKLDTDIVDNRLKSPSDPEWRLQPYTTPVVGQTRVVIKSDRIHTDKLPTYKMQSQHDRGVLFIVNIIDFLDPGKKRSGAEGDGDSLIHVFREIGFTIFNYHNLNQEDFFSTLHKLTESDYVKRTECFVLVLMTHGERINAKDRVLFSDGSLSEVKKITDHFQADKCPHLRDKPKVLIFPFCRGDKADSGRDVAHIPQEPQVQHDSITYTNVPTLTNMLVAYASVPGYETHRDPTNGSWYIQKLCDVIANNAHDTCMEDLLKLTEAAVAKMRTQKGDLQTAQYENSGFSKKLFFNPGCYLDPNTAN